MPIELIEGCSHIFYDRSMTLYHEVQIQEVDVSNMLLKSSMAILSSRCCHLD